jgi:ferredoxin
MANDGRRVSELPSCDGMVTLPRHGVCITARLTIQQACQQPRASLHESHRNGLPACHRELRCLHCHVHILEERRVSLDIAHMARHIAHAVNTDQSTQPGIRSTLVSWCYPWSFRRSTFCMSSGRTGSGQGASVTIVLLRAIRACWDTGIPAFDTRHSSYLSIL